MRKIVWFVIFLLPFICFSQSSSSLKSARGITWQDVGQPGFSEGIISSPKLAFSPDGKATIAFKDCTRFGKITVMQLDGTTWINLGTPGFSQGPASDISFAFSPSGQPYVSFSDSAYDEKVTVMKFNGTAWELIGNPGFSAGRSVYTSLAFFDSDEPCVGFLDWGHNAKATVMKYNGTNWINIGEPGFSPAMAAFTSLAVDSLGRPWIAFSDGGDTNKTTVMNYNGTIWEIVGNRGFSRHDAGFQNMVFNPSGQPFVAFTDFTHHPIVKKYDGTVWVNEGEPNVIQDVIAHSLTLAFHSTGTPYIGFFDWGITGKGQVMKYDGVNWNFVGTPDFTPGLAQDLTLAISPAGDPFVAFADFTNASKASAMFYDETVSINPHPDLGFTVSPNPVSSILSITFHERYNDLQIELFNSTGTRLFISTSPQDEVNIDISSYASGLYFIKVYNDTNMRLVKIIKSK